MKARAFVPLIILQSTPALFVVSISKTLPRPVFIRSCKMGDAATPSKDALLSQLKALVSPDEIISPDSPSFKSNSEVWSHAHYLNPKLVLRPRSLDSLSKIIAFLGPTDLDFRVRSQGYGNASARDVLISLTAFDDFGWDEENKIVTLGPGMPWAKYYDEMPKVAPGWTSTQ